MRGDLRRATRPLRALPRVGAPLGGVATVLPPALFGGELLDVLSERLRALLVPPGGAVAIDSLGPLRPSGGPAEVPAEARPATPGAAEDAGPATSRAGVAPPTAAAARPEPAPGAAEPASNRRAPIDAGTAAGHARGVTGDGALAERIRRYWRAVDVERARARETTVPPLSMRHGGAAQVDRDDDGPGRRAASLPDPEVASALGAFVAGDHVAPALARPALPGEAMFAERALDAAQPAPLPGANGRRPPARSAQPDGGPAWPRPGAAGGAPSRAAALRGLADDVGEILREQALRHGIDVP
jgi:hypothetical protein